MSDKTIGKDDDMTISQQPQQGSVIDKAHQHGQDSKKDDIHQFLTHIENQLQTLDLVGNQRHLALVIEFISLRFSHDLIENIFIPNGIIYPQHLLSHYSRKCFPLQLEYLSLFRQNVCKLSLSKLKLILLYFSRENPASIVDEIKPRAKDPITGEYIGKAVTQNLCGLIGIVLKLTLEELKSRCVVSSGVNNLEINENENEDEDHNHDYNNNTNHNNEETDVSLLTMDISHITTIKLDGRSVHKLNDGTCVAAQGENLLTFLEKRISSIDRTVPQLQDKITKQEQNIHKVPENRRQIIQEQIKGIKETIKKKQDQIQPLRDLHQQLQDDNYFTHNTTGEAFIQGENLEDDTSKYFAAKNILYPHKHPDLQLDIPLDEHFPLGDGNLPQALHSARREIFNSVYNNDENHSKFTFEGIVIHIEMTLIFHAKDRKERRESFNLRGKIKGMSKACDAGDMFALQQAMEIKI